MFPVAKDVERHEPQMRVGLIVIVGADQCTAAPGCAGRKTAPVDDGHTLLAQSAQVVREADTENASSDDDDVCRHSATTLFVVRCTREAVPEPCRVRAVDGPGQSSSPV